MTMTTHTSQVQYVPSHAVPQARVLKMARQIFSDTFSHLYDENAFRDFCEQTWAENGPMAKDLADPSVHWRIATVDEEPIGYAKLTPLRAPAQDARAGALELQQIYVLGPWHGKGIAEELMGWAVQSARAQGAPELYLTVFDHNQRAKRFYTRHGFEEVGRCTFQLGDRVDDDRIWRKVL